MSKRKSPAEIAAETYINNTRRGPGGAKSQAGRLRFDAVEEAAALMAKELGLTPSTEERREFLIRLDETESGSRLYVPIRGDGIDLKSMTTLAKHEKANEDIAAAAEAARLAKLKAQGK